MNRFITIESLHLPAAQALAIALEKRLEEIGKTVNRKSKFRFIPCEISQDSLGAYLAEMAEDQPLIKGSQSDFILRDRYLTYGYATLAYDSHRSSVYNAISNLLVKPDLSIWIDIPPSTVYDDITQRKHIIDLSGEMLDQINYMNAIAQQKMSLINFEQSLIVDGTKAIAEQLEEVFSKLNIRQPVNK